MREPVPATAARPARGETNIPYRGITHVGDVRSTWVMDVDGANRRLDGFVDLLNHARHALNTGDTVMFRRLLMRIRSEAADLIDEAEGVVLDLRQEAEDQRRR